MFSMKWIFICMYIFLDCGWYLITFFFVIYNVLVMIIKEFSFLNVNLYVCIYLKWLEYSGF